MKRLLFVVDDEPDIREIISYYFRNQGFDVLTFENPLVCLHSLNYVKPDLLLLDWLMPNMNGIDFCRKLKEDNCFKHIPIIMITCKSDENEIVTALENGADDYMIKPFRLKELHCRINRCIKHSFEEIGPEYIKPLSNYENHTANAKYNSQQIIIGKLIIDSVSHEVLIENKKVELTYAEFKLLELLASSPNKVFTREQIIKNDGGDKYHITDRAIDVRIVGLRKKLGETGKLIKTVRSVGYKLTT